MGVKLKIMLKHDPTGKEGVKVLPADVIEIRDPTSKKDDKDNEEIRTAPAQQWWVCDFFVLNERMKYNID